MMDEPLRLKEQYVGKTMTFQGVEVYLARDGVRMAFKPFTSQFAQERHANKLMCYLFDEGFMEDPEESWKNSD
jgi:hypothetical protein